MSYRPILISAAFLFLFAILGSGLVAYGFGVSPRLPDQRLGELTADYKVVRLAKTEPITGPDGPGELAWIWPVAAVFVLAMRRRCRRRT